MTKTELEIFKSSGYWQEIRSQLIDKYETCVVCDGTDDLDVHCRDLERIRRADIEKDLTLMCLSCRYRCARDILKQTKPRPKKKNVKEQRNTKIRQAEEFLWQQTQRRFNEIKQGAGESHLTEPVQKKQPFIKRNQFVVNKDWKAKEKSGTP